MTAADLSPFRLETPLPEAFVMPDFIDAPTEAYLLSKIEELGGDEIDSGQADTRAYKSRATPNGWRAVKDRRLMEWGWVLVASETKRAA